MGFLRCTDYSLNSHFICAKQEKELLSIEYILSKSDEIFLLASIIIFINQLSGIISLLYVCMISFCIHCLIVRLFSATNNPLPHVMNIKMVPPGFEPGTLTTSK